MVAQEATQFGHTYTIVYPWVPTRDAPTRSFDRMMQWMWLGITINLATSMLGKRPGSHGGPGGRDRP